jgi:hypothetical protein
MDGRRQERREDGMERKLLIEIVVVASGLSSAAELLGEL